MKVFLSSLIAGFEPLRSAGRAAIVTLRHEPIMAEDFGAQPNSPQIACLSGLRKSDVVVLILGERYGASQPTSQLSATHEEYREARGRKPVIAFVQDGITPEPEQAAFIAEVQGWEGGLFRGAFSDPANLQAGITRALHDYELSQAVGPVDPAVLIQRATALISSNNRNQYSGSPSLVLALAGGPIQQILRPVEIEAPALSDALHQAALFGETRIFDPAAGVRREIEQAALVLEQERGARVQVDEQGAMSVRLLMERESERRNHSYGGIPVLLEERVQKQIAAALSYTAWLLEHIDPTQRLSHVAVAARIEGGEHLAWRTQQEHDQSPNSVSVGGGFGHTNAAVHLSQPRAALRLNRTHIIEDLLVPLRRQWKAR